VDFFADPLGGLADEQWDELASDRFYSSAFWLRLVALEPGATSGGIHVPLAGGGRAAVPAAAVADADELPNPHLRWTQLLAERGLPNPPPGGLLIGQRRGYLAHLLRTPGADPAAAAAGLLDAVRSVPLPAGGGARVALYLTTPDVLALRAAGVRTMPVALAADAWIEIPHGGWDAWLASHSMNMRRRVRKEARQFENAGYQVVRRPLPEVYAEVGRLTARTEQRYGIPADPDAYVEGFRKHAELAGDRAEVLLCAVGDEPPVGCVLFVRDGDTVYLRAAGFDYDRLRGVGEYFNLAYYTPARFAGVRWLHAGIGTPDGKALRGAELRALWLLDLTADSPLLGRDDAVLAHNSDFRARLAELSPVVAGALVEPDWKPFC
jgi:hypothetical protein